MAETVGDRLKQIRGKLTQKEFAEKHSLNANTYGNYERNRNKPSLKFIHEIAAMYDLNVEWILYGQEGHELLAKAIEELRNEQSDGLKIQYDPSVESHTPLASNILIRCKALERENKRLNDCLARLELENSALHGRIEQLESKLPVPRETWELRPS